MANTAGRLEFSRPAVKFAAELSHEL